MSKQLIQALDVLEEEKGISKEVLIDAIEAALISAYRRHFGQAQNVKVVFDPKKGECHIYAMKEIIPDDETVFDSQLEIHQSDIFEYAKNATERRKFMHYEVGDEFPVEITPDNFGRIAAQTAKQVILQRVREAEREIIYNEFSEYEKEILQGTVERQDSRYVYVNLGKIEAVLSQKEQMPNEVYKPHEKIKVYVSNVESTTRGPQVFVSRSHPNLVKRLFENEVPEIFDGSVEIMSIAREAGDRSKIAVRSKNENIDPVGTMVGPRGQRVQTVVNELHGENMDIIEYSDDKATYICNALNPAKVLEVVEDEINHKCIVIVPTDQLSLAIGKGGQNARLAARLTGQKIDIKSEDEWEAMKDDFFAAQEAAKEEKEAIEELGETATSIDDLLQNMEITSLEEE
ncbi:transcription termination factor NusA [Catellicoccus marimammalium]|uniref:Transcription termination/antitermination protein NusA n=1 Tax=Catellicoccus marimammalium M35/04/3 TaxID=1234409 RepID=K8ZK39_9ENTE|nr:transcription termination factor NusA [Catellicoccus marimammalium]EKU26958.1 Transcription termination protein NusA [Catellicoccus marimammalium M35/04/3]